MIAYPKTIPHYSTVYGQWGLKVLEDWTFNNINGGVHTVPAGYWYNAGSIPALFWQLTFDPYHPVMQIAALPHDWAYFSHCMSKKDADDTLHHLLITLKANPIKSAMVKSAVSLFGESSYKLDNIDYVYRQQLITDIESAGKKIAKYGL